jgi:hypothetical protein
MRRILLFAVPITVAALLVLIVISRQSKSGDTLKGAVINSNENAVQRLNSNSSAVATGVESVSTVIRTVSRQFAERYSTNSSLTPTSNLSAVLPYTSVALTQAFQRTIANPPAPSPDTIVTTSRAFAFNIQNLDEKIGRASVVVSLQRSERKDAVVRKYQQDLSLQLIRENGVWKVNFAVFLKA